MKIPASYTAQGVTKERWTDWRWQISHAIKNGHDLARYFDIPKEKAKNIDFLINNEYSGAKDEMRLTPHLLSLINFNNPTDPIALQHIPNIKEQTPDNFTFDTVWETDSDFLDGKNRMVQQKYPDIILLRLSNTCHSFCRFCFQKERTLRGDVPTKTEDAQFENAFKLISEQKNVYQILISGGDPLILSDAILKKRIESLLKIPHIKKIRINTRTLLHNPFRITKEFASMLSALQTESWQEGQINKQIHVGVHFNHPNELTTEALNSIHQLQRENIQIYNQTVLLKGINDTSTTLSELFRVLLREGIKLHYLSQAMMVPRTVHFRTSIKTGQKIMQELRNMKEFRGALPHFELSHHTGKQIIPDTMNEFFYESEIEINDASTSLSSSDVTGTKVKQKIPVIKFLSDITQKWETFIDGE